MPQIQINGRTIEVNPEGFLVSPDDWSEEVAHEIASAHGIELTPRHWEVISFCRTDYQQTGKPPGVRRITKFGGIPTREMYQLFPKGPGKLAAKLSGLQKPTGCV